jgi:hypothetical protein
MTNTTMYTQRRDFVTAGTIFAVHTSRTKEFKQLCASLEPVFVWDRVHCIVHAPPDRIRKLCVFLALNGWNNHSHYSSAKRPRAGMNRPVP